MVKDDEARTGASEDCSCCNNGLLDRMDKRDDVWGLVSISFIDEIMVTAMLGQSTLAKSDV